MKLMFANFPVAARQLLLILLLMLSTQTSALAQDRDAVTRALDSVVRLEAQVPTDARTARFLGTHRTGTGIVIDDSGLVLTIGYLILEAMSVTVTDANGAPVPAKIVAYDYDTGFGLVRATSSLERLSIRLGESSAVETGETVLIVSEPGRDGAQPAEIVAVRQFTGYWEYLLEDALFASPPHPAWQGAAMIGEDGQLLGVGSLFAEDAARRPNRHPGNMFVPVDALKPILGDLLTQGRSASSDRPWLGLFTSDHRGFVVVTFVAPDGPAAEYGVQAGDVILEVAGERVRSMAEFFQAVWKQGKPGTSIPLTLGRNNRIAQISVVSKDRYEYMRLDSSF